MTNNDFWQGKRVFLTGHTGFKGSWLSLWLQQMGAVVTGYSLEPEGAKNLFTLARAGEGLNSIIGDVRDAANVDKVVNECRPEIVIHMAAQALVRQSYVDPAGTYSTNIMGLVNVLEAARKCSSVRSFVNVTSDKCYENKEWVWGYREDEPMGGHDPYSSSKGCAELITSAYQRSFCTPDTDGMALASARAGNVIGGGDWAKDRLIPDIMRAIESGHSVSIRNPTSIRPWQHVLEPLGGYLLLAQKLFEDGQRYVGAWNFGPTIESAKPVQWVVEKLVREWGAGASWQLDKNLGPHEAQFLGLDCTKARVKLNWCPTWDLSTTLSKIVQWHQQELAGESARSLVYQQIKDFTVQTNTPN